MSVDWSHCSSEPQQSEAPESRAVRRSGWRTFERADIQRKEANQTDAKDTLRDVKTGTQEVALEADYDHLRDDIGVARDRPRDGWRRQATPSPRESTMATLTLHAAIERALTPLFAQAPAELEKGACLGRDSGVGSQREFRQATQAPHRSGRNGDPCPGSSPPTRRSELQLAEHEQDDQHDNNHPDDTDPAIAAHAASCELPGTGIPGLRPNLHRAQIRSNPRGDKRRCDALSPSSAPAVTRRFAAIPRDVPG